VTWIYEQEELGAVFCRAMRRDVSDLAWHMVNSLFRAVYVTCSRGRPENETRLAEATGFAKGS
jgi:hypothetical protein